MDMISVSEKAENVSINNIIMAGIDHSIAKLSVREMFSFTRTTLDSIYARLAEYDYISGIVIISTCNRTEIYISLKNDTAADNTDPFELLCRAMSTVNNECSAVHIIRRGEDAIKHLCELSCGMKSQIWGEDQIISQVKSSIIIARENKSIDSLLEVMFRTAVTAAKKVKTQIKLTPRESSVVVKAMDILKKYDYVKNVLVIGNGEIGRLMTEALIKSGYNSTITLRQYKHSMNIVPSGAGVVEYNNRYSQMLSSDAVISATLSPHHTVELTELTALSQYPRVYIDLAVPRDIDPEIGKLNQVSLYDIDSMCAKDIENNHNEQLKQADKIIEKYIADFKGWCRYKSELLNQA